MCWSNSTRAGQATYHADGKKLIDKLVNNRGWYRVLNNKIFLKNLIKINILNIQQTQDTLKTFIDKILYIFL